MTRTEKAPGLVPSTSASLADPETVARLTRNLMPAPRPLSLHAFVGRSLFPLITLMLIAGTVLWGPWVTLALATLTWTLVGRHG